MTASNLPRSVRLNNPGNIRHGDKWLGLAKDQPDEEFCKFETPEHGARAMARILQNYQRRLHLKTLRAIISRWAPQTENPTDNYLKFVCCAISKSPDEWVNLCDGSSLLPNVMAAMAHFEAGGQFFEQAVFDRGAMLAEKGVVE